MSDLITARELADELRMSYQVVLRWNRAGRIKAEINLPGKILFDLAKVRRQLVKASEERAKAKFNGMVPTL